MPPLRGWNPSCNQWKTGVYRIYNTLNGKCYVGGGYTNVDNRLGGHEKRLKAGTHPNKHLQAAWNKYGEGSFIFEVLERCSPRIVQEREQHWIDTTEACNPDKGYNKSPTAGSPLGVKHSEETLTKFSTAQRKRYEEDPQAREKAGRAMRGKKHSKETTDKMSISQKQSWADGGEERKQHMSEKLRGRKWTAGQREKIPVALAGRKLSEEHIAKLREINTGRKHTTEEIKKRASKLRGKKRSPEVVAKVRASLIGTKHTDQSRANMSAGQKKRFENEEQRIRMKEYRKRSKGFKGKHLSEEAKAKLSAATKKQLADPERRRKSSEGAKKLWDRLRAEGRTNNRRSNNGVTSRQSKEVRSSGVAELLFQE